MTNPMPNPQDPDDAMYQFIDQQPEDVFPVDPQPVPDSSPSHFTTRQYTPTDITNTFPIVVTVPSDPEKPILNGQFVRATKFIRMPYASATGMEQLNNQIFMIQQATTTTFQLYDTFGLPVDGRGFTPYISGGQFTVTGQTLPVVNPSHFPPN